MICVSFFNIKVIKRCFSDFKDLWVPSHLSRDLVELLRSGSPLRIRVAADPEVMVGPTPFRWRPVSIFAFKPPIMLAFNPAARRCSFLFFALVRNTHSRRLSLKRRRFLEHKTDVFDPIFQINSIQNTLYKIHAFFSS